MIRLEHLPADVLELSELARTALSGRFDPELLPVPRTLEAVPVYRDKLDRVARAELAAALESNLAPLAPHVAVLDAVRALARPGASAVVTGQQPGFLAAPLYSLYKALQAVRLARSLSERWEQPVVALFWNHADDHDVAEVHHAYLLNANLDLQKFALAGLASGKQPLSRIVLDDEQHRLGAVRAALTQLCGGEAHAERALEVFVPRHGESFARAFTRAFTELLGPHGLVVLEPDWIRPALSAQLERIVTADPAAALAVGSERVRARGLPLSIDHTQAALVFAVDEKGRRALRAGGDGFRYDGESGSRTHVELAAEIVQEPLAWSPGALLRPLVQDLALPVAAYVGGFGELGYHAQLGALRDATGAPHTPFVPRISCTLVDEDARLALARLEASVADVIRARGVFAADAGESIPLPAVVEKLRAAAERSKSELNALRSELSELDPGLAVQLKRTAGQNVESVESLIEKITRVHQNKSGKGRRHERRVNNLLYPRALPQERVLGPMPFVARYGEDWIRELLYELDPLGTEHLVVHLGTDMQGQG